MKISGLIVLAVGAALLMMAIKGSWANMFPQLKGGDNSGGCPPGYTPCSVTLVSGVTDTNYCSKTGCGGVTPQQIQQQGGAIQTPNCAIPSIYPTPANGKCTCGFPLGGLCINMPGVA